MTDELHREPRIARALAILGLIIALVGAAGFALNRLGLFGSQRVTAESLRNVLLVAASPDDTGSAVGQIIVIVDVGEGVTDFESVSPALDVSIPGTSYTNLADAYPFGGGKATAVALARASGEEPLPYVAIGPDALATAIDGAGGATIDVPAPMAVFDGNELYRFAPGAQRVDAAQVRALLKGAPYLTARERSVLDASLGAALIRVMASQPSVLSAADTNLDADALLRLGTVVNDRAGEL